MNIEEMIQGNPQALVMQRNGVDVADSLQVAECFGKRHTNVLRTIEALINQLAPYEDSGGLNFQPAKERLSDEEWMYEKVSGNTQLNFEPSEKVVGIQPKTGLSEKYFIPSVYKDSTGRDLKHYWLTRDGFSLLVMGFTGPAALHWKLLYIEAFNQMEEKIKAQPDITAMVTQITTQVIQTLLPEIKKAVAPPEPPKPPQIPEKKPVSLEDLPPILTVYDIRDYLQIGQRQAYELVHDKDFPAMKIGNRLLIQKSDFAEWLQRRKGYV